jgi:hypothetical protein
MNPPSVPAPTFDAWDVIDQWIEELTRLAREPLTPAAFQNELLRRIVEALAARRATVWEPAGDAWTPVRSMFGAEGSAGASGGITAGADAAVVERAAIVAWTTSRGEPVAIGPGAAVDDDAVVNPTPNTLLVCTWSIDGTAQGALEVEQRGAASPDARQGALRLLATFAAIAADYQRNLQRLTWKAKAAAGDELEAVLATIHNDADLRAAAYSLANEGRRWVGSDRASVLIFDGRRCRAAAISGVDTIDRRADAVHLLERLATEAAKHGVDIDSRARAESLLPQVERALAEYVEHAEARELSISLLREPRGGASETDGELPQETLTDRRPIVGVLVVEQFTGDSLDEVARERIVILQRHGSAAIAHAAELERIPLGRLWRRIGKGRHAGRRRLRLAAWLGAITVVCAVPFFIPAPLTIEARGTLEPRERRDLFAPTSGIVHEVAVDHGDSVKRNAELVKLRKPELEVEFERLRGEIRTTEQKRTALRAGRTAASQADSADRRRRPELDAEEKQLEVRLEALAKEQELVAAQDRELSVVAPVDGSVTTWETKRRLTGKPVERGYPLLSLAELDKPWILELRVPDRRLAEVVQAQRALGEELEVEFIAAADPQSRFTGRLVRLADTARTDSRYGTTIAATVQIGDGKVRDDVIRDELRRPGASVIAKIHCGRSSYGAIWTADLLHYLRTRWLF